MLSGERFSANSIGEICEPHGESVHVSGVADQCRGHQRGACLQSAGSGQQSGTVPRAALPHRVAHLHVGHRSVSPSTCITRRPAGQHIFSAVQFW